MIKIQQGGKPDYNGYGRIGWVPEEVWEKIDRMQNHNHRLFSSADTIYQFNLSLNEIMDGFNFVRCMAVRGTQLFFRPSEPNDILKELI